jgi:hypothetical protein
MQGFVAYYRVSTDRQGQSGLGLDAQRAAVAGFVGARELVAEFTGVESGVTEEREVLYPGLRVAEEQRVRLGWGDCAENPASRVSVHRTIPPGVSGYKSGGVEHVARRFRGLPENILYFSYFLARAV